METSDKPGPLKVSEELYELAVWLDVHLQEAKSKLAAGGIDTESDLIGYIAGLKFAIRSILNPLDWEEPNFVVVPDDPDHVGVWVEIECP